MIQANELRIGNYVAAKGGKSFQVNLHHIYKLQSEKCKFYECKFYGIPSTEEWLLKFGFEEDGPDWYFMSSKDRFTDIGYSYNVNKNIFEVNEWEVFEVKYIHQLQNLYFALTGKELEINMTADEILKKHEDANEMHFHEVDRKWIIEAMEEYARVNL